MSSWIVSSHEATHTTGASPPTSLDQQYKELIQHTSSLPSMANVFQANLNHTDPGWRSASIQSVLQNSQAQQTKNWQQILQQLRANALPNAQSPPQPVGQVPVYQPPRPAPFPCKGNLMAEKVLLSCFTIFTLMLLIILCAGAAAIWGDSSFWMRVAITAMIFAVPAGIAAAIARTVLG
jgi:hypothetical protein